MATTEYAGSVRAAQALKTLPASLRKAMAPELQVLGNGTISFHVWIDGQHHTRKITDVETVNGETVNTTVNITAINQPVQIALPPPARPSPRRAPEAPGRNHRPAPDRRPARRRRARLVAGASWGDTEQAGAT